MEGAAGRTDQCVRGKPTDQCVQVRVRVRCQCAQAAADGGDRPAGQGGADAVQVHLLNESLRRITATVYLLSERVDRLELGFQRLAGTRDMAAGPSGGPATAAGLAAGAAGAQAVAVMPTPPETDDLSAASTARKLSVVAEAQGADSASAH